MTLAGTDEIIATAAKRGYGVGAFDVIQLEHAKAIVTGRGGRGRCDLADQ